MTELLVSITIIGIMLSLSFPAIRALKGEGTLNRATLDLSLRLDQARSYAMAHNTYVWVGFYDDPSRQCLIVSSIAGTTGAITDLGSPDTLYPISKIESYDQITLGQVGNLNGMPPGDDVSQSSIAPFTIKMGSTPLTFSKVIQFNPSGGASIDANNVSHAIQLGLQPAARAARNTKNVAAIQVAGLSGQVHIYRP